MRQRDGISSEPSGVRPSSQSLGRIARSRSPFPETNFLWDSRQKAGCACALSGGAVANGTRRAKDECGDKFRILFGRCTRRSRRRQPHDAFAIAVDPGALPGDDPPAAEAAKAVAGDAGLASRPATGLPPPEAFAASSSPSRTIRSSFAWPRTTLSWKWPRTRLPRYHPGRRFGLLAGAFGFSRLGRTF